MNGYAFMGSRAKSGRYSKVITDRCTVSSIAQTEKSTLVEAVGSNRVYLDV
jgi:hypothetical protein